MRASDALKWLLFLWMAVVIWVGLTWVPAAADFVPFDPEAAQLSQGQVARIVFFHVPTAWVAVVAFLLSCVASILYLRSRDPAHDVHAAVAAGLGLVFAVLATVTGAIFARVMWGMYWNWDPRQTSIAILLLIYAAYLALRGAVSDPEQRANLSAVYSILAFVTVPFLVFVVPRVYKSLHPDSIINTRGTNEMDPVYTAVLMASLAGFTGLFVWLYSIGCRVGRVQLRRRHQEL